MKEFSDVVLGTFTDIAKMVRSLLSSRTTWVMAIGFVAIWMSSGKVEAIQQLLAYLGLGSIWVIKMGAQNVVSLIKGNGLPAPKPEPKPIPSADIRVEPELKPLPPVVPEKPFDVKAFHERVLSDVGSKYSEVNPFTVFSEAKDRGSVTTCYGIQQAKDYWDYLVPLAYAARDDVKERTERAKGACKGVAAPELVLMESQLARILRDRDNVYSLTTIPWANLQKSLDANDTLYMVGSLSEELLRTYWP
jgi:hypothetical protein